MTPDARIQAEADQLEARWRDDPRWAGVKRTYGAADAVRLRGSVVPEHTLARNGAERLWELGVDLAYTTIVGDRPEDMEDALRFMAAEGLDLILTSGGLGPTADDLTAEVVGRAQGRKMVLDEALEGRIAEIL